LQLYDPRTKISRFAKDGRNLLKEKLMVYIYINVGFAAGCESLGVVIKDSRGDFIVAPMNFSPSVLNAQMADAYAPKEGLHMVTTHWL
jgi:hypothetical protein